MSKTLNQINPISKVLLDYRILNKLTQREMTKLIKCTQSQYSLWETGQVRPHFLRERDILEIIK